MMDRDKLEALYADVERTCDRLNLEDGAALSTDVRRVCLYILRTIDLLKTDSVTSVATTELNLDDASRERSGPVAYGNWPPINADDERVVDSLLAEATSRLAERPMSPLESVKAGLREDELRDELERQGAEQGLAAVVAYLRKFAQEMGELTSSGSTAIMLARHLKRGEHLK